MARQPKVDFFLTELERHINSFDKGKGYYRDRAFVSKMMTTALGGLTTILLGLDFGTTIAANYSFLVKDVALMLTALVTSISAWDAFFEPQRLWLRYNSALTSFYGIKSRLQYRLSDGPDALSEKELDGLYDQMTTVLEAVNKDWQNIRSQSITQSSGE